MTLTTNPTLIFGLAATLITAVTASNVATAQQREVDYVVGENVFSCSTTKHRSIGRKSAVDGMVIQLNPLVAGSLFQRPQRNDRDIYLWIRMSEPSLGKIVDIDLKTLAEGRLAVFFLGKH